MNSHIVYSFAEVKSPRQRGGNACDYFSSYEYIGNYWFVSQDSRKIKKKEAAGDYSLGGMQMGEGKDVLIETNSAHE